MEAGAAPAPKSTTYGSSAFGNAIPVLPLEVVDLLSSDDEIPTGETVPELCQETVHEDKNSRQRATTSERSVPIEGSDDEDSSEAWETESFYEDTLNDMGNELIFEDGEADICTVKETATFRKQLRSVGPSNFLELNIDSGAISAKKLLTAFGIQPPPYLEGAPDKAYYGLLIKALERELRKRAKLPEYNTVDDAVKLLKESKNIIVLTGAGISTSLGIPDFRSSTGLYSKIRDLGLDDPQEVFDLHRFEEDPSIFYSMAKEILPSTKKFSPTHAFIRLLQEKGKLLTNYTQNIDNIEMRAGINVDKLIQCHGSFAFATCQKCKSRVWGEEIFDDLKAGIVARCKKCPTSIRKNGGTKRKRAIAGTKEKRKRHDDDDSDDNGDYSIPEAGVMKPDIIFFGEDLPDIFHERLEGHDKDVVDLVVVIGTSLLVAPVAEVVNYIPRHVPQIYINRNRVTHTNFDIDLLGDCDVVVAELCRHLDWHLNHEMVPKDQKVDIELVEGTESCFVFTEVK